jgi:predicted transcriptional regulator
MIGSENMEIDTSLDSLIVFEALASDTRLKIINLLAKKEMNIKTLAEELFMSSAIVTRHIKKLEDAHIVKTERAPGISGSQKICKLAIDQLFVQFPKIIYPEYEKINTTIKLGHYTNYQVEPTCGLATKNYEIGTPDEAKYFMASDRMNAEIIWFSKGFIEYKVPNILKAYQHPEVLELSFEISSEFPGSNNNWPSDITFFVNDVNVGSWTVPGNYADVRGKLTPKWWPDTNSQYGLLKTLRINKTQTNIDGDYISAVTINDIDFKSDLTTFRFCVNPDSTHVGGLTIFGKSFGNHEQDIEYTLYYSQEE